jgi:GNAT superfamily N-acetyltransferase
VIVPRRADHPDARALIAAYFSELEDRLGGFDPSRSVSASEDEMEPPRGVFLVLYDPDPCACGGLKVLGGGRGEIKRMYVAKSARGRGHGRAILRALEQEARRLGCTTAVLDTAAPLDEAKRLYASEGYLSVPPYNANPYACAWFEKRL